MDNLTGNASKQEIAEQSQNYLLNAASSLANAAKITFETYTLITYLRSLCYCLCKQNTFKP